MFYSVDILTRKGRLGLIWLAATYGESKRGMMHREYRKVNISRACRDIVDPVVPFALRLSSNLMVGVVRIYREQTKFVWVEATHIYKTLKNASELRVSDIDLVNPTLREEAITDPLDFTTDAFRLDLEIHSVTLLGPESYFTVNGNGHPSPPPPPVGPFSPPSIPGTPVQHESPGWLPEWRAPSGSDNDRSPYQARAADIRITEVDHIRIRQDEPIRIPDEVDITGDLPLPDISMPPSLSQPEPRPDARRRSPRPRSRSPRARSRSPRRRSRSPRRRSRSPRTRSRSPRRQSRSPRRRSRSPRSRQPRSPRARSPRLHSPARPRDEQPVVTGAPPPPDRLAGEPSLANVLVIDEATGELTVREGADDVDIPTSTVGPELAVPTGFATPGVRVTTATPSPPKKRRKMPIDTMTQLRSDVIKRNVDTEGRDTLRERRLDEHHLKSAKDLFMEPTTEALRSYPFLELWKGNAVTTPEEYHSSDSVGLGKGSPELPTSPFGDSREVARSMETPSEKEIPRAAPHPEGSGLFEHSAASTADFTPDFQDSGLRPRDLSISGDQGLRTEPDVEPVAPRGRSSSILRSSMAGLLSPIHEPSDLDDYMDEIGDLPTLMEQSEVTQPLEEQAYDTWRLVTKAFGDSAGPVKFINLCPPPSTSRKHAAKVFYHLLALHRSGVFELKQRDPYMLTNIYIDKGVNY